MNPTARRFCLIAALLLALATVIGAVGTHALRPHLTADHYAVLQTAVNYQYLHSLGLLGLGLVLDRHPHRWLRLAAWLLCLGVVLFCGSLYLILAGAPRLVGLLTPIGGAALIAAWFLAACALSGSAGADTPRQPPPPL